MVVVGACTYNPKFERWARLPFHHLALILVLEVFWVGLLIPGVTVLLTYGFLLYFILLFLANLCQTVNNIGCSITAQSDLVATPFQALL